METKVIMYSPVGLPRRIEVTMTAHFRCRFLSVEFFKIIRCSMIEGDHTTKNIILCSNEIMELPEVKKLGDDQVWEAIENPQTPGLTRSTAEDVHKWLFGNASSTTFPDYYTLLKATLLSVGAIDWSFAEYPEYCSCRVEVSEATLRETR